MLIGDTKQTLFSAGFPGCNHSKEFGYVCKIIKLKHELIPEPDFGGSDKTRSKYKKIEPSRINNLKYDYGKANIYKLSYDRCDINKSKTNNSYLSSIQNNFKISDSLKSDKFQQKIYQPYTKM